MTKFLQRIVDVLKKDFLLLAGNYFQQGIGILFGILVAKKLTPEAYGVFGLALLFVIYAKFLNLGAQFAINKRLSLDKQSQSALIFFNFNLLFFSLLSILVCTAFYLFGFLQQLTNYWWVLLVYLILENMHQLILGVIRAKGNSKLLGKVKIISGIWLGILIWLFFDWQESDNPLPLFVKLSTVSLVNLSFLLGHQEVRKLFKFHKLFKPSVLLPYIITGMSLGAYVFLQDFLSNIDRLFIASYFSADNLGQFTFSFSIANAIILAMYTLMYMDYSRYMREFKHCDKTSFLTLRRSMWRRLFSIYLICAFFGLISLYFILKYYLTAYSDGSLISIIILISFIPNILNFPYFTAVVARGKTKLMLTSVLIGIIFAIGLNFFVVATGASYFYIIAVTFFSKLAMFGYFRMVKLYD